MRHRKSRIGHLRIRSAFLKQVLGNLQENVVYFSYPQAAGVLRYAFDKAKS